MEQGQLASVHATVSQTLGSLARQTLGKTRVWRARLDPGPAQLTQLSSNIMSGRQTLTWAQRLRARDGTVHVRVWEWHAALAVSP